MNNKGQMLSILFSLFIFIIFWVMFFGSWVTTWTQNWINNSSLTGLEAFLVSAMNIWILAGVIIGVIAALYVGGGQ